MSLRDVPVVGGVLALGASLVDLVAFGGEAFLSLVFYAALSPESWLSIVLYAQSLAARVAWLPETPIQQAAILALVFVITLSIARFLNGWWSSRD
jgi:hypothetical protein